MSTVIEKMDRNRVRLLEWHLAGFFIFFLFSLTRFFFRARDINTTPVGITVLSLSVIGVLIVGLSTLGLGLINRKIRFEPGLQEALNNEYIRSIALNSWKAAYIGSIASTIFFTIISFIYPVHDPVFIALNSIVSGAGAYHLNFYLKYKRS